MRNTTLCYMFSGNRVLMLYRNKKENDVNGGKWVGVGGKFLPNESPDACLLREVYEETSIVPLSYELRGIVRFCSDVWEDETMYLYAAYTESEELAYCDEGELNWIEVDRIMELPMWEGDRYFLEPLIRGEKNINLDLKYEGDELVAVEYR